MRLLFAALALAAGAIIGSQSPADYLETGTASWYGSWFQGERTSNGEIYDKNEMTAAHRTMAFGTMLEVVNLDNEKSCVVRVNDRGPFVKDRIIDLSEAAARKLGFLGAGTAKVGLRLLSGPPEPSWDLQVASYGDPTNAARAKAVLEAGGFAARIVDVERQGAGPLHRVIVGPVPDGELESTKKRLEALGFPAPLARKGF
jgi:rare lipoprotein A